MALLPRMYLFELLDQRWFPALLRRAATDYLATMVALGKPFHPLAPRLSALLRASGTRQLVDLCSGGAGPYPGLLDAIEAELGEPVSVTLTDLHPDPAAFARAQQAGRDRVRAETQPIDALDVPPRLSGVRTIFDGFHHFREPEARALLEAAARERAPIFIAEASERSLAAVVAALFIPLFVLLVMPRVRPLSLSRLLLTYVLPVLPLVIFWDGLVSCLRTWTAGELRALAGSAPQGYTWEAGTVRVLGRNVSWLAGTPQGV